MKNIWIIAKKDLFRFFKDKRMVMSILIMPCIMIYSMSLFFGLAIDKMNEKSETTPVVSVYGMTTQFENVLSGTNIKINKSDDLMAYELIEDKVRNNEIHAYIVLPDDIDGVFNGEQKSIEIYYNSCSTDSNSAYNIVKDKLKNYELNINKVFDINSGNTKYDFANEKELASKGISKALPVMIILLLFAGCMAIAPEAIAGEKERGTIATMLVTPIRRSELAIGKILSVSIVAFLSGISNFIGTILSMNSMGDMDLSALQSFGLDMSDSPTAAFDISLYGIADFALIFVLIISSILVIVSILSLTSAISTSIKEANSYATPVMAICGVAGASPLFIDMSGSFIFNMIPLCNSAKCLSEIFAFNVSITSIVTTIVFNLLFTLAMVYVLAKMFESEKIIYTK